MGNVHPGNLCGIVIRYVCGEAKPYPRLTSKTITVNHIIAPVEPDISVTIIRCPACFGNHIINLHTGEVT